MLPVRAYLRLLFTYLRPLRRQVGALAVGLFVGVGLQLANPQLIRRFIDGATNGRPQAELVPIALAFIGVAVAQQALAVASAWLAEDVGWRATNRLRAELAAHALGLDLGYHKEHAPGHLIERVDGDVTALSNFFSAMVLKVVGNGLLVIGILVLLFRESWLVGASVSGFTALAILAMTRLHAVAVPWWRAVRATAAETFGHVGEQVEGTEDVAANGAAGFMQERFAGMLRSWLPLQVRGWTGWALLWNTHIALYGVATTIVFVLGTHLFGTGALTIGAVYLVFHYTEMIREPMTEIRTELEDLQKAGAAIARVEELFATSSGLRPAGGEHLPAGALSVAFDQVSFAYPEAGPRDRSAPVLHDVTFEVAPRHVLGILGRTGSGKSTLARLLTRLYEPQAGVVRIGGIATWDLAPASLRRGVGMVTQDVQLFRASVRDNLTFFDRSIDDGRLLEVIRRLELEEWLASLPQGLDTELSSGSGGLSAGQAQLLAFTRIFLADPGVVVLDEASSRLDPATERLIERAVDHLLDGRTGIIIAHRLHTLARADEVLVLEDGHVVEFGDRRGLADDPTSRYAGLLATGMEEVLA